MANVPTPARLIHQRVDTLSRRLTEARLGDVEGIHQARVATRRLREALPLLPSSSRRRKVANAVRKLTRALGPVREIDVCLQGLGDLERLKPRWKAALRWARDVMLQDRRAAHLHAVKRIGRWDSERVRKAARYADEGLAGMRPPRAARAERLAILRRRAAGRAEELHAAVEHAAGIYLPDRLHQVRIAAKKLRYALEMIQASGARRSGSRAAPASPRSVRGQVATLKRVQDLLGRIHDHEMLIMRLRAAQGALAGPRVELAGDLDAAVRYLETECRRLHGHYMAVRPGLLDVAARVLAAQARGRRVAAA